MRLRPCDGPVYWRVRGFFKPPKGPPGHEGAWDFKQEDADPVDCELCRRHTDWWRDMFFGNSIMPRPELHIP